MKKYQFLFTALLNLSFLLSCGNIKNYTDPNYPKFTHDYTESAENYTNNLKVVSFNIKFSINTVQAVNELMTNENLKNSDIILLQEMDEAGVAMMAKTLKMNYIYFPACLQRYNRDFGNAILSKLPIRNDFKLILPFKNPLNRQQRIASGADLLLGDKIIRVYSIHTEVAILSVEDRMGQVETIIESIPDSIDYVIVGGDFNTVLSTTTKKIDRLFKKVNLYQATKEIDYTTKMGPNGIFHMKLDHIFVRGLHLRDSGSFKDSKASDHLPVWANFTLIN
jgi:endonuclease/exonuclease/phosphatase family metal-dependent hydrolase